MTANLNLAMLLDARETGNHKDMSIVIRRALGTLRKHLNMELAFISEFGRDERIFRYVDTVLPAPPIRDGDTMSMNDGYCRHVAEGRLPQLIPDTAHCPAALAIPATTAISIGAHISVLLHRANGDVYGTLCCFSSKPDPTLTARDLAITRAFAELIGQQIQIEMLRGTEFSAERRRITEVLEQNEPAIAYQPIFRLTTMERVASEALSRFSSKPHRTPDKWFAEADKVGLRNTLELKAIANALADYRPFRTKDGEDLSINCSPGTIIDGGLEGVLANWPAKRIILEITEHDQVDDYDLLAKALVPLRARGIRIAIDDAGSGFASMRHILNIGPDFIKLDVSLTRNIDNDPRKRALALAFVTFGHQIGAAIIGEGVETQAELDALRELGVEKAQGYFLGKPASDSSSA